MSQTDSALAVQTTRTSAELLLKQVRKTSQLSQKLVVVSRVLTELDKSIAESKGMQPRHDQEISDLHGNQISIFNGVKTLNSRWENLEKTHRQYSEQMLKSVHGLIDKRDETVLSSEKINNGEITFNQYRTDLDKQLAELGNTIESILDDSQSSLAVAASDTLAKQAKNIDDKFEAANKETVDRLDDIDRLCKTLDTAIDKYHELLNQLDKRVEAINKSVILLDNHVNELVPKLLPLQDDAIIADFEKGRDIFGDMFQNGHTDQMPKAKSKDSSQGGQAPAHKANAKAIPAGQAKSVSNTTNNVAVEKAKTNKPSEVDDSAKTRSQEKTEKKKGFFSRFFK